MRSNFLLIAMISLSTGCATHVNSPGSGVDALMGRYDGAVPGASLLVIQEGKLVVQRGYGLSDLEHEIEAGPTTNYRLASVTKQFTASAILLLAEDGKLELDDRVRHWLPSLPAADDAVTLRHLLTHTSGLVDYEDVMAEGTTQQLRDADVLRLLESQDRTYFEPGSEYRYSNSGYALLALVAERASAMSYPDYLRSRIFQPLGMRDTLAYVAGGPEVAHRAWGYSKTCEARDHAGWTRTDQNAYSAVLGDGGIYSSIADMARWDAALYDDRLLSDASRALAFGQQVQVSSSPEATYYGFGWRIASDRQWHSGESIGFRNTIVRWPRQRLSVIVLSNRNEPTPYATAVAIGKLFLADVAADSP